jgi:sporulation protein YlmC with PRC-barrel domain
MDSALLVACSSLCGEAVVDAQDAEVGRLDHMLIDPTSGRIAYAVLSRGGVFGIGQTLFEVPWTALSVDAERQLLILRGSASPAL